MEAAELMGGHDQVCLLLDTPRAGSKGHRCFVSNKENLDEDKARQLVETARKDLAREGRFPGIHRCKEMVAQQTFAVGHWVVQEGTSAREAVEVLLCLTHTENDDVFHELERILREFPEQERNSANERPSLILQSEYLRNAFTAKFSTPRRTDPEPRSGTLKSKKENWKMKLLFVLSLLAAAMIAVCAFIYFLFFPSDEEPEVKDVDVTSSEPGSPNGPIAHLEKHDPGRKQLEQWELKSAEKSAENQMKELKGFLREFNKQLKVLAGTITSHPKSEAFNQYRDKNGESLFPLITHWKKKIYFGEIDLELEIQTTDKDYNEDDKACMNNLIECIGQVSDDSLSDLKAGEMETKTWNSLGHALRTTKREATKILQETPNEHSAATRDVFDEYIRLMEMISNRVDDIIPP